MSVYEKSECCELILNQYPQLLQLFEDCPPPEGIDQENLFQSLLWLLSWSTCETYQRLKCGRVFCCEGIVNSIFKSIRQYLAQPNFGWPDLIGVIDCILIQTNFFPLNCDLILQTTFAVNTFINK